MTKAGLARWCARREKAAQSLRDALLHLREAQQVTDGDRLPTVAERTGTRITEWAYGSIEGTLSLLRDALEEMIDQGEPP